MLEWNPLFSVNIAQIDAQHRRLLEIINTLEAGIRDGHGRETLASTFRSLVHYTREHFATEEDLMRRHNFPGLTEHEAEHREMTEKLAALQRQYERDSSGLTIRTISFLCDWLTDHLLGTDKEYTAHLNAHGVR